MHHKNIKLIIKKQLKKEYPNWKKLPHKEKKAIAKKVLDVAKAEYDFSQEIEASLGEL